MRRFDFQIHSICRWVLAFWAAMMVAFWIFLVVFTTLLLLLVPLYDPHHELAEVRGGNTLQEQITLLIHMSVLFGSATFISSVPFLIRTALATAWISYWVVSSPDRVRQRVLMATASAVVAVANLFVGILEEGKTPDWDRLWLQFVPVFVFIIPLTLLLSGWLVKRIPVRRGNVSVEDMLSKMFVLYGSVFAGIILMYSANMLLFIHRSFQEDTVRLVLATPLQLWKQHVYAFPSQWWISLAMVVAVVIPASCSSMFYPWSERVEARCTSVVVSTIIVANLLLLHLRDNVQDTSLRPALVSLALVVLSVVLSGVLAQYLYRLRKHRETLWPDADESDTLRGEDGPGSR